MSATVAPRAKLYKRFAEVGRIVVIQYGPDAGKLATIVDIVDQNRALVDGPANITGVKRQVINFKWVALTDLKLSDRVETTVEKDGESVTVQKRVGIARNARQKTLTAAWKACNIEAKFAASSWGKKIAAKAKKAGMSDFERFQSKVQKQKVAKAVAAKLSA